MSVKMGDSKGDIDPEVEVRKLQDLVRKLEKQNELLRSKKSNIAREHQNNFTSAPRYQTLDLQNVDADCDFNGVESSNLKDGLLNKSLEDVELLDLDRLQNTDDEDSWLYSSPARPSSSQEHISPYKWLREEFEHPSPEFDSARKSLLFKLEECSLPRSSSSGTLGGLSSPGSAPSTPLQPLTQSTPVRTGPPSIRQPLLGLGSRVDTSTFTRPKKRPLKPHDPENDNGGLGSADRAPTDPPQASPPPASPRDSPEFNNNPDHVSPHHPDHVSPHHPDHVVPDRVAPRHPAAASPLSGRLVDENANGHSGASSGGSQESLGLQHKLTDVVDVQVVARMQEESLRQSFSSPLNSTRKSSITDDSQDVDSLEAALSRSLNRSTGILMETQDGSFRQGSNRSSPGRFDSDYHAAKRSNNSLASMSSTSSSPPGSPYGSQYLEQKPHVSETHRRSLPNLAGREGHQLGLQSHPSDPRLRDPHASPASASPSTARRSLASPSPSTARRSLASPSPSTARRSLASSSPGRHAAATGKQPSPTLSRMRPPGSGLRQLSPNRTMSPNRTLSPQRTMSPPQRISPQRTSPQRTSPQRMASAASPQRALSPQRASSPNRPMSPGRSSGIPGPKSSGIPRPGSTSKLPTPRRSSIPSLRKSLTTPKNMDESWKDGCY